MFKCKILAMMLATVSLSAHAQSIVMNPTLDHLKDYASLLPQMREYAKGQGFTDPIENNMTAMHELVHIGQAHHRAFLMDSGWVGSYITDGSFWQGYPTMQEVIAWSLDNHLTLPQKVKGYITLNPFNKVGNVLDEINAYRLTVDTICTYEKKNCQKSLDYMAGHLALLDLFMQYQDKNKPYLTQKMHANTSFMDVYNEITQAAKQLIAYWGADVHVN